MKHLHKVEKLHKSLGVKVSHLKAIKEKAIHSWKENLKWLGIAVVSFIAGAIITIAFMC